MTRAKRYSVVEAATILNCSVYDVKKAIMRGKLRGEKHGIGKQAPWLVLLSAEQVAQHTLRPTVERTVTNGKAKATEKKVAPDQAPDSEIQSIGDQPVSKRTTGLSPVDWLG